MVNMADEQQIAEEQALKEQYEAAVAAEDYELAQELMQELIAKQREFIPVVISDEELAAASVDLSILTKERQLAEQIRVANQNGDFMEAKQLMRDLRQLQQLQPIPKGVSYGQH